MVTARTGYVYHTKPEMSHAFHESKLFIPFQQFDAVINI